MSLRGGGRRDVAELQQFAAKGQFNDHSHGDDHGLASTLNPYSKPTRRGGQDGAGSLYGSGGGPSLFAGGGLGRERDRGDGHFGQLGNYPTLSGAVRRRRAAPPCPVRLPRRGLRSARARLMAGPLFGH